LNFIPGTDGDGKPVFLKDIWPTRDQIQEVEKRVVVPSMFNDVYSRIQVKQQLLPPTMDNSHCTLIDNNHCSLPLWQGPVNVIDGREQRLLSMRESSGCCQWQGVVIVVNDRDQ
jgi:aconitase A